jgi:hypothetical protein
MTKSFKRTIFHKKNSADDIKLEIFLVNILGKQEKVLKVFLLTILEA